MRPASTGAGEIYPSAVHLVELVVSLVTPAVLVRLQATGSRSETSLQKRERERHKQSVTAISGGKGRPLPADRGRCIDSRTIPRRNGARLPTPCIPCPSSCHPPTHPRSDYRLPAHQRTKNASVLGRNLLQRNAVNANRAAAAGYAKGRRMAGQARIPCELQLPIPFLGMNVCDPATHPCLYAVSIFNLGVGVAVCSTRRRRPWCCCHGRKFRKFSRDGGYPVR